jgi:hypothetical protein
VVSRAPPPVSSYAAAAAKARAAAPPPPPQHAAAPAHHHVAATAARAPPQPRGGIPAPLPHAHAPASSSSSASASAAAAAVASAAAAGKLPLAAAISTVHQAVSGAGNGGAGGAAGGGGAAKREAAHTCVLKMRGLPFSARKADVIAFFGCAPPAGVPPAGGTPAGWALSEDSIHIVQEASGRPAGIAFVEFAGAEEARAACAARNRKTMGARYVELFPSSRDEATRVATGGGKW